MLHAVLASHLLTDYSAVIHSLGHLKVDDFSIRIILSSNKQSPTVMACGMFL
jgi:hypothetical protein